MFVREPELAHVRRRLDGPDGAVVVRGAQGSGRSTFARSAVDRLPGALAVGVAPAESSWPFAGISSLLHAVGDDRWRRLALTIGASGDADVTTVAHRILAMLHEHDAGPHLLLVDDADLLDQQSLAVVGFLARRLAGTGLRLVLLVATVPAPLDGLEVVDLAPLDRRRARALVAHLAARPHHPAVLDVVADRSAGSPAQAVSLLAGLTSAQAAGRAPLELPLRHERSVPVVDHRAVLPPAQAAVVELLALAPRTRARDVGTDESADVVDELVTAGWVVRDGEWLRVADAPVRSAVYYATGARRRREHHRAAALRAQDPCSVEWHSSFVDPGPRTAADLRRAATALLAEGAPDVAFEFVERSLLLSRPDTAAADHLLVVAAEYFYRGALAVASRYVDIAQGVEDLTPHQQLVVASLRVRIEYVASQTLLTALAERALDLYGASAPDEAVLLRALLATYSAERWELTAAAEHLERTGPLLGVVHEPARTVASSARILLDAMSSARVPASSRSVVAQVGTEVAATTSATTALMTRARALTYAERYDDARSLFRALLASPTVLDPLWALTTRLYDAENDRLAGDLRSALATIATVVEHDDLPEAHRPYRLWHALWYFHETGRSDLAHRHEEELLDVSQGRRNPAISARVDAYLGARALHAGDLSDATRTLMRCRLVSAGLPGPHLYRCDADLVEALVRSGDRSAALTIGDDLVRRCTAAPSRWGTLAIARCRALLAEGDDAVAAFERAVAAFHPQDNGYELARTLSSFAARLGALGHDERAAEVTALAAATYRRIGLPWWADDLVPATRGPGRGRAGAGRDRLAVLTDAEREVVELVGTGLRNRDVAARLFLSVRAVESRLTTVYRKLGVRSRVELISSLADR